jgi:Flp pilus assembly protein TadB
VTAVLIVIAGVGGLAALAFYWLWKRERRQRIRAEKAAALQAERADAEREMREKVWAAEQKWRSKYEALQRVREEVGLEAAAAREEIDDATGDAAATAAALNKVLGHEVE